MSQILCRAWCHEQGGHGWSHDRYHCYLAKSVWSYWMSKMRRPRHEVRVDLIQHPHLWSGNLQDKHPYKTLVETLSHCQSSCRFVMDLETGMDMQMGVVFDPKVVAVIFFKDPRDAIMFKLSL